MQRQVVVETQNQAACFCFEVLFVYIYDHVISAVLMFIDTYIEYRTGGRVSQGILFCWSFGWEFMKTASFFLRWSRKANDWFGLTPKDWFYIFVTIVILMFLWYKIISFIFRIMDGFNPESDKPETSETREPRKKVDARVRGARGKSPGAKKEE